MFDFTGQTVIITGGGSGIGRSTVDLFLEHGATVAVIDRDISQLSTEQDRLRLYELDVRDEEAVHSAVAEIGTRNGRIDVLINAAGVDSVFELSETSSAEWDRVHDINVKSHFLTARSAIPFMREHGGSIVNVSSQLALVGVASMTAYTSSKAAVAGLTRSLALELASAGIRVNAIGPGPIDTPLVRKRYAEGNEGGQGSLEKMRASIPLGHLGAPEDIARPIAFLCSPSAAYITGSLLIADGGYTVW